MITLKEYSYHNGLWELVEDYMSEKLEKINICDTISEVGDKFIQPRYRKFTVMDGNRLVGQISRKDILRVISQLSKED